MIAGNFTNSRQYTYAPNLIVLKSGYFFTLKIVLLQIHLNRMNGSEWQNHLIIVRVLRNLLLETIKLQYHLFLG